MKTQAVPGQPLASFAMYPFDGLNEAYDAFWADVHRQLPWTPQRLDWTTDVHDTWLSASLVVSQTCGWPLVTHLASRVRPLGSFRMTHDLAEGSRYRTVIVAREDRDVAEFSGETAAVNSEISLSGWISLMVAVVGPGSSWGGKVVWTGAHVESLRALQRGDAMVASIDSVSLQHISRLRPELLVGLHEVGYGPLVPGLPLITSAGRSDEQVADLRAAIAEASTRADPTLLIDGFDPLDDDGYADLLELGPERSLDDQHD
jgi:ABC-type phosphate/phosphonate transport system substrate-binding protein